MQRRRVDFTGILPKDIDLHVGDKIVDQDTGAHFYIVCVPEYDAVSYSRTPGDIARAVGSLYADQIVRHFWIFREEHNA